MIWQKEREASLSRVKNQKIKQAFGVKFSKTRDQPKINPQTQLTKKISKISKLGKKSKIKPT
jgi:hypothetical protein